MGFHTGKPSIISKPIKFAFLDEYLLEYQQIQQPAKAYF